MPRRINPESHRVRRDAFLDAAERLIQTKGYERMSIRDVLDELDTSRGALYHYFDSKQALLDGVVERLAERGMAAVAPTLGDSDLPALQKLERVMGGIASFKAERTELVVAIMEVWNSDGNALVRERVRRLSARWLSPILSTVIRQGIEEGVISAGSPDETARVLIFLMQGFQELAGELFVARQAGTVTMESVLETFAVYGEAFERVLGVAPGSIRLVDEPTLRYWYEMNEQEERRAV